VEKSVLDKGMQNKKNVSAYEGGNVFLKLSFGGFEQVVLPLT
jgi:hypothetical protein